MNADLHEVQARARLYLAVRICRLFPAEAWRAMLDANALRCQPIVHMLREHYRAPRRFDRGKLPPDWRRQVVTLGEICNALDVVSVDLMLRVMCDLTLKAAADDMGLQFRRAEKLYARTLALAAGVYVARGAYAA